MNDCTNSTKIIAFDLDDTLYQEIDFVMSGYRAVSRFVEKEYGYADAFAVLSEAYRKHLNPFDALALALKPTAIDIDRLVAYTGYSRSRLFDIFKEHTGLTPSDWISRRRIKEACLLLETTDQPTNAVARSCGFTSPQYFNAVFKRRTGTTPTEWRQRNG